MNDDDDDCEGTDPIPILAPLVTSLESILEYDVTVNIRIRISIDST